MPTNIVGFGTMFIGERDYTFDGSYVTTEFVTVFYLPVVPLRSFRAVETINSFRWMGPLAGYGKTGYRVQRLPLRWRQVGSVYGTLALCISSFAVFLHALGNRFNPGPLYDLYSHPLIGSVVLPLTATWPLIVGRMLRAKAKRQVLRDLIKRL
jgi:hypothetical protein